MPPESAADGDRVRFTFNLDVDLLPVGTEELLPVGGTDPYAECAIAVGPSTYLHTVLSLKAPESKALTRWLITF